MPSSKRPKKPTPPKAPPWQVILEEMRSQNRLTIEAVEASRVALEQRIDHLDQETRARDATLETALRQLRVDVQELRVTTHQHTVGIHELQADVRQLQGDMRELRGEVRGLAAKVEALARIEDRVTALEKGRA